MDGSAVRVLVVPGRGGGGGVRGCKTGVRRILPDSSAVHFSCPWQAFRPKVTPTTDPSDRPSTHPSVQPAHSVVSEVSMTSSVVLGRDRDRELAELLAQLKAFAFRSDLRLAYPVR